MRTQNERTGSVGKATVDLLISSSHKARPKVVPHGEFTCTAGKYFLSTFLPLQSNLEASNCHLCGLIVLYTALRYSALCDK